MKEELTPISIKDTPAKKASVAKHRNRPLNSGKKTYWVVLPENMEGKWFTSEVEAQEYINSLKNCLHEMRMYINFRCVENIVRKHNDEVGQKNSKFLWELKKEAGLV